MWSTSVGTPLTHTGSLQVRTHTCCVGVGICSWMSDLTCVSLSPSVSVLAGDDAKIRVWQVPEGGLTETLTEPELILQGWTLPTDLNFVSSVTCYWLTSLTHRKILEDFPEKMKRIEIYIYNAPVFMYVKEKSNDWQLLWPLIGHTEKIYSIKFHPLANGLLVSSSYDLTVRLWNLDSGDEVKLLTGHQDQVGDRDPKTLIKSQNTQPLDMDLNTYWLACTYQEGYINFSLTFLFAVPLCGSYSGFCHGMESRWQVPGHSVQRWESSHLWPAQVHYTSAGMSDTLADMNDY